jgi:hypothetical protein
MLGDIVLMSNQDNGAAALAIESLKRTQNNITRLCVQVPGRLISKNQRGIVDQRPRDGDALNLPSRQLA